MVHIAQCEMFYEQSYYTPSEEGFMVFDTKLGKIGIVVCFDRHYPESTADYCPYSKHKVGTIRTFPMGSEGSGIPKQHKCGDV